MGGGVGGRGGTGTQFLHTLEGLKAEPLNHRPAKAGPGKLFWDLRSRGLLTGPMGRPPLSRLMPRAGSPETRGVYRSDGRGRFNDLSPDRAGTIPPDILARRSPGIPGRETERLDNESALDASGLETLGSIGRRRQLMFLLSGGCELLPPSQAPAGAWASVVATPPVAGETLGRDGNALSPFTHEELATDQKPFHTNPKGSECSSISLTPNAPFHTTSVRLRSSSVWSRDGDEPEGEMTTVRCL